MSAYSFLIRIAVLLGAVLASQPVFAQTATPIKESASSRLQDALATRLGEGAGDPKVGAWSSTRYKYGQSSDVMPAQNGVEEVIGIDGKIVGNLYLGLMASGNYVSYGHLASSSGTNTFDATANSYAASIAPYVHYTVNENWTAYGNVGHSNGKLEFTSKWVEPNLTLDFDVDSHDWNAAIGVFTTKRWEQVSVIGGAEYNVHFLRFNWAAASVSKTIGATRYIYYTDGDNLSWAEQSGVLRFRVGYDVDSFTTPFVSGKVGLKGSDLEGTRDIALSGEAAAGVAYRFTQDFSGSIEGFWGIGSEFDPDIQTAGIELNLRLRF